MDNALRELFKEEIAEEEKKYGKLYWGQLTI